jgi:hypothetical protein
VNVPIEVAAVVVGHAVRERVVFGVELLVDLATGVVVD